MVDIILHKWLLLTSEIVKFFSVFDIKDFIMWNFDSQTIQIL